MSESEFSRIYVDIESLLDLRQAALSYFMEPEKLAEFLGSDEYNFRDMDTFQDVDMEKYNSIYQKKDVDMLPRATITYIINILRAKIDSLEKRNVFYGKSKKPEILLNIHPFKLNDSQTYTLQNLLFVKLDTDVVITIISKPIEEITPHFIKSSDIAVCFMYDFTRWLDKHTEALNKLKLQDTIMYFPALYKVRDEDSEMNKIQKAGFKDLFGYVEFLYSSITNISFLPVVFYTNLITSTAILEKYNEELKTTELGDLDGDISSEV